jgi:O-6-methylguanine DNA methyltransferase
MPRRFSERVLRLLEHIPKGRVTTYKAIAHKLGTRSFRAVGNALNRNRDPQKFPCYKVVSSDGSPGGFSLGRKEKIRRLKADGIIVRGGKIADFGKVFYGFK